MEYLRGQRKLRKKVKELTESLAAVEAERNQACQERDAARYREGQAQARVEMLTKSRQLARDRADAANVRVQTLRMQVDLLEEHHAHLHEQIHVLWDQLHPHVDQGAAESANGEIQPGEVLDEAEDETAGEE